MTYRSTSLRLMADHCPKAGSFYEHGYPDDRPEYVVGACVHSILEAVGIARERGEDEDAAARAAMVRLVEHGRKFEGRQEPPAPGWAANQALDIVRRFLARRPLPDGARYEVGIAVDREWRVVEYASEEAWLSCIVDALWSGSESGDPDWLDAGGDRLLCWVDWKGWPAGNEAQSLQRKIQALLVWRAFGGPEYRGLAGWTVSYQTGAEYAIEPPVIYPDDPDGAHLLRQWRRDVEAVIALRERQVPDCPRCDGEGRQRDETYPCKDCGGTGRGWRPAQPGPGCMGCPFLTRCPEYAEALARAPHALGHEDLEAAAEAYAVLSAEVHRLGGYPHGILRGAAVAGEIPVDGGSVGFRDVPKREPVAEAPAAAWRVWAGDRVRKATKAAEELRKLPGAAQHVAELEQLAAAAPGLVQALGVTVTGLEKVARVKWPDRGEIERRRQWVDALVREAGRERFGTWKGEGT